MRAWIVLIPMWVLLGGCFGKIGANLGEGLIEGIDQGEQGTNAVERIATDTLEKELLRKLGAQLGEGLVSGATEISPEQRKELEDTIDALISVAAYRSGKGLREEVGPEFRRIVRRDIVEAFADGLRGELGASLEETTDRVITRAVRSLEENLQDESLKLTVGEILREGVYDAVNGGNAVSPGVGVTLEETLTQNVLDPFSNSVGGVADRVAWQVNESAKRTENLLKTIISGLIIVLGALAILYFVRDRQARRARQSEQEAHRGLRSVGAAMEVLDDETRRQVFDKLDDYRALLHEEQTATEAQERLAKPRRRQHPRDSAAVDRSNEYLRGDDEDT